MIVTLHIPDADVLGFDRSVALFKILQAAAEHAAETAGCPGVLAAWEPEQLQAARERENPWRMDDEFLPRVTVLRAVD